MTPRIAMILTLGGLLPFLWGALTVLRPDLAGMVPFALPSGRVMLRDWGVLILSFMGGALWGFAARERGGAAAVGYVLAVVPALWGFIAVAGTQPLLWLAAGFGGLLLIDALFVMQAMAPRWWLRLRVPVTAGVLGCLAVGIWL